MNILEIVVIILTVIFAVTGYCKGFVRKLASLLSLVVSVALVSLCLPYVTDFLKNSTPVYDMIVKQCREVVEDQIAGALGTGGLAVPGDDISADQIAGALGTGGLAVPGDDISADQIAGALSVGNLADGVPDIYQNMGQGEVMALMEQEGYDSSVQNELIEKLPLPKIFRDQLLGNNNAEGYRRLGVSTFQEYVVQFSATAILNVVSFIVAFLLVQIALRMVIAALDILSQAPVLSMLNRVAGLLLGLLQMLFLLWIFFMAVSAASATEGGLYLMSMIQQSRILGYLYDSNLFLRIVLQAAGIFL